MAKLEPGFSVNIGKIKLKNPVMVASGTFGYAQEFVDFIDLKKLGAIVTKTITLHPRQGNPPPRTCETPAGMLNSIGLENPGIDRFIAEKIPPLKKIGVPLIVSIASQADAEEFIELSRRLDRIKEVSGIELNISCPNIKKSPRSTVLVCPADRSSPRKKNCRLSTVDSRLISQDAQATYDLVKSVRRVTKKTLITKLSPNVTDIAEIASSAQEAGSDAISLINTLTGLSIDINSRAPKIASVTGGLSGPCIRPVAVRMVHEVYEKIKIPIIGMGGIIDAASAIEFFIAGAAAVSVGTASFINPRCCIEIIDGIKKYLTKNGLKDIKDIIGSLKI